MVRSMLEKVYIYIYAIKMSFLPVVVVVVVVNAHQSRRVRQVPEGSHNVNTLALFTAFPASCVYYFNEMDYVSVSVTR